MKAKEYLNQVKMLEDYMDRLSNEYFKMKELAMNPGGFDYSKERVQSSAVADTMSRTVGRYVDLETEMNECRKTFEDFRNKAVHQMCQLCNTKYTEILYQKYINYKSLKDIAEEMEYSYDWIRHAHGWALQEFQRTWGDYLKSDTFIAH